MEMKGLIYSEIQLHAPHSEVIEGFSLISHDALAYPMQLTGEEATTLLQMTPFAWRAKPEVWETLKRETQFDCQTDFAIHAWQREAD